MKTIIRNNNILGGASSFHELVNLKKVPVYIGCVSSRIQKDIFSNQSWKIDKKNGMIQLNRLIPLKILYKNFHTSGDVGKLWHKHHDSFCKFLTKYNRCKNIFEIGGAKGFLAQRYLKKKDKNISWNIVEPNPDIKFKDKRLKVFKGFFDAKFKNDISKSTVVHSHTLEHLYDPMEFLSSISRKMSLGSKMFVAIPNMLETLKRKYTNSINFEHSYYLREEHFLYMMKSNNFKLLKKEKFLKDHSIFYCFQKINNNKKKIKLKNLYKENKLIFDNYIKYHKDIIYKINNKIKNSNNNVYLFGAHIFSQTLISMGLNYKKIKFILDNDKLKKNKRLYGTKLYVKSPKILKNQKKPIVILKCGVYNKEIKKDIINNINNKTIFI